eukprot:gene44784-60648_t
MHGHADVADDHVDLRALQRRQQRGAIGRFDDDVQAAERFEQRGQALADQGLIVGQCQAKHGPAHGDTGSCALNNAQHAAERGHATPWHMVHLGKFALGGAGLILTESTAVDPRGRIGTADLGLWNDNQIAPLKAVVDFVHAQGSAIGVQLAHAGRKAGSEPLWEGGAALDDARMAADEEPWE